MNHHGIKVAKLTEGTINNPRKMTFDDLVVYLNNVSDANATLMNSIRIIDAYDGDVNVIPRDTSAYDALIMIGELEPEVEDEQAFVPDDPWNENGPFHKRGKYPNEYVYDDELLVDVMKDSDGTIDGEDPDTWMENYGYDLYISIPMNIRRPDGKSFDRHDVGGTLGCVNMWFAREFPHFAKPKRTDNIRIMLDHFVVGDTKVDVIWEFA